MKIFGDDSIIRKECTVIMANPMNFMKYISDPEISPFLSKAMSKLQGVQDIYFQFVGFDFFIHS